MAGSEQPVGYVERLKDGKFNRYLCPVKTLTETVPVYLTNPDDTRSIAGYYNGKDKGLKPASTWAWIMEAAPCGEYRIPVYCDA